MSVLSVLAGLVCGVLSGYGIGGGSLLLLYMTNLGGLSQRLAQGINLLYFLPASAAALVSHVRHRLIDKRLVLALALPGTLAAALGALCATSVDPTLLRRLFGMFCVIVGVKMLLKK